ncbi:bile acid:sodium symporter family protein [Celeribacter persicus]|uniref:Sodium bile acid symporter family protein n=1 Tax=Celeribacter persicus TaxID=1651082 RepID=A0A2T5H7G3_9RHOB|nr:bile acid:sodium symporter [Celeribacter persicus]PTQ67521.1 sodium bile acid symporter family protein [Celeribacter persicus]
MTDIDSIVLNFSPTGLLVMNAILAIVMFSVALDLKPSDFAQLLRAPKPLLTGLASQFVVLPTLTFLMILVLQPSASVALGLILVAACPGGNISNFITHRAGGNAALSVSMTGCATMGAIVLTPLNIAFWGQLYTPSREILSVVEIDPVRIAITVSLMLLLPLLAGIVLYR